MKLLPLISLSLLLCATGCSTTPTPPVGPPQLQAILQPESVEGKYKSRDEMMLDPAATPVDGDNQLIQTEAALRRANRDQIDAAALLQKEVAPPCGRIRAFFGGCK